MLDPKYVRENVEKIRQMLQARAVEYDLDKLIGADKERRDLILETDDIRHKKNSMSKQIAARTKAGEDISSMVAELKEADAKLAALESRQQEVNQNFEHLLSTIPNIVDESVPVGPDETANVEVRRWGDAPKFDFKIRDHIDITASLDLVDLERAAKVSGSRFYYLKDDLMRLDHALISYSLDFLSEKGYTPVQPPYMINKRSMQGAAIADDIRDVIYKVQDDDLYLIGTSEHAIAAMHADEILEGARLPIRYAGSSPCFRKEAGAHGRDQKGIFRVHQFSKVEQFVFCRPDESWAEHEKMLAITEEFYRNLGIPHRVVLLSSGDMGKVSAKTYDIEAWMAAQDSFREVVSCSNCLDYQARRLSIRFRDRTNEPTQYLHTLNSTLAATSRVLVAIIEDFQRADGHIDVPPVLRDYVRKEVI